MPLKLVFKIRSTEVLGEDFKEHQRSCMVPRTITLKHFSTEEANVCNYAMACYGNLNTELGK